MPGPAASLAVNTTCPVPRSLGCNALPVNPDPCGDTALDSRKWAQSICASAHAPALPFSSHDPPELEEQAASAKKSPPRSAGKVAWPAKSALLSGPQAASHATHCRKLSPGSLTSPGS